MSEVILLHAMPIVYVGSPLRAMEGDPGWDGTEEGKARAFEANVEFAEKVCHAIAMSGGVPYAPHLLFPRFFDDAIPEERDLSLKMGQRMIGVCDEAWFMVPPWRREKGLSTGMSGERDTAEQMGIATRVCIDVAAFEIQLQRLVKHEVKMRTVAGTLYGPHPDLI